MKEWIKPGDTSWLPEQLVSRIKQLRRLMLVHSCLYYRLDESIVSDHQWQAWANELAELQGIGSAAAINFYDEEFKDWDGSTGYHLPADPDVYRVANRLLKDFQNANRQRQGAYDVVCHSSKPGLPRRSLHGVDSRRADHTDGPGPDTDAGGRPKPKRNALW